MKIVGLMLIAATFLFALQGEAVFEKKCASCHSEYYIPQSKLMVNYQHNNKDLNLTAPTVTELSFRIKDQVGDRTLDAEGQKFEIEDWLTQFFKNPKVFHTILPKNARNVYGQMPPVKVTEEETEALADFLYEYAEKMMIAHGVKRYSYDEALQIARKHQKIILIEGYLPFCRGCIWMDRNVMVEPEVKAVLNKDFVLVRKNLLIEKLPLGMKRLGTPSFYFIAPDGKRIIDMVEGSGTKEEFLSLLTSIKERVYR